MPASPSSVETAPSCITPSPDSAGSSSCSASTPPASRWYWSAWRSRRASRPGSRRRVKPAAPSRPAPPSRSARAPACPCVIAARKPTGTRASTRGALVQRAQHRRGVHDRIGVRHREHRSRSRRRRPRACRTRGPPRPRARACAGGRAGRRSRGTRAGPRLDHLGARRASSEPGAPISAISPSRTSRSSGPSRPARGSSSARAADQRRRRPRAPRRRRPGSAHALMPAAPPSAGGEPPRRRRPRAAGRAARRGSPSAPRGPLATWSTISAWGESITSADSSTPRLTGPGCIRSWRGCEPAARRSGSRRRTRAATARRTPLMRSFCIRSA